MFYCTVHMQLFVCHLYMNVSSLLIISLLLKIRIKKSLLSPSFLCFICFVVNPIQCIGLHCSPFLSLGINLRYLTAGSNFLSSPLRHHDEFIFPLANLHPPPGIVDGSILRPIGIVFSTDPSHECAHLSLLVSPVLALQHKDRTII